MKDMYPERPGVAVSGAVTVHPVPALHGLGGDQPVGYEFSPGGGPARFLGYLVERCAAAVLAPPRATPVTIALSQPALSQPSSIGTAPPRL